MFIMKESEVDWIKRIPTHWNTNKCKYISLFINGYSFDSKKLISDYIFPVIRIGDINGGKINYSSILGVKSNNGLQQYKTQPNDILLAMSGATVGKIGLVNIDDKASYINQRVGIIRSKFSKYLFYCLSTNSFIEYILLNALGSAQPNVSTNIFNNFKIPFPSLIEQHKIADFLDQKCSEIDALTADIQTQIETLEEYKKSVITEAVTKGLDPNVEMKDSGVEWVGKIPKDWGVIPVKFCFSITNGSDPKSDEGDTPVYGSGKGHFKTCKEFKKGPTVLLGRKGTVNIPQWIEGNYWNVDTAFDVHAKGNYLLKLFFYAASCFDYDNYSTQTALPSMTQSNYLNFRIPFMNVEEQRQIVDFLDQKCAEIDQTISEKQQQLETLAEYKKSLIYEYVTGKKEVA